MKTIPNDYYFSLQRAYNRTKEFAELRFIDWKNGYCNAESVATWLRETDNLKHTMSKAPQFIEVNDDYEPTP